MYNVDLEEPLLKFHTRDGKCHDWTINKSFQGVFIAGSNGSGKSSSALRQITLRFLEKGYSGLVTTVKPKDCEDFIECCKAAGRLEDLVILRPNGEYYFNIIDYILQNSSPDTNLTDTLVEILSTVLDVSDEKSSDKNIDPFWSESRATLITSVIDLALIANGTLQVRDMLEIVQSLPVKEGDDSNGAYKGKEKTIYETYFNKAADKVEAAYKKWKASLDEEQLLKLSDENLMEEAAEKQVENYRIFKHLDRFFNSVYYSLSEKTRSIITLSFSNFLLKLERDPIYSIFCKNPSNITPDDCYKNKKIIVLNFPTKIYHGIGKEIQCMFKVIYQLAVEKRDVGIYPRPLFLISDEHQETFLKSDIDFQLTARSSRVACVYITQSISNYHVSLGGAKSEHRVKSLLGVLGTKIFFANSDIETNRYASELIGDAEFEVLIKSTDAYGAPFLKKEIKVDRLIKPEEFTRFKTGGKENNFIAQAVVHVQGNLLSNYNNFIKKEFNQNFTI